MTDFTNQKIRVFHYLQTHTATASMVAAATGIPQKNICRYKRQYEKTGQLWEVKRALCLHTGHPAWYLTTNPNIISHQMKRGGQQGYE